MLFKTSLSSYSRNTKPKGSWNRLCKRPQSLLNTNERDSLNHLLNELDTKTGVETAVVIIRDFKEDEDAFTFATALFRHWGIGKRKANNGLYCLINRKQYRFITGYSIEGLLPDATLSNIGENIWCQLLRNKPMYNS
jgi:uncharacterized protein